METRELTCIGCPMGCQLLAVLDGGEIRVTGNQCARGEIYAKKEVTAPERIVTSAVPVKGGAVPMVSVNFCLHGGNPACFCGCACEDR